MSTTNPNGNGNGNSRSVILRTVTLHIIGVMLGMTLALVIFPPDYFLAKSTATRHTFAVMFNVSDLDAEKPGGKNVVVAKLANNKYFPFKPTDSSVERDPTSPRVFCWILTHPGNKAKAKSLKDTWLRRCDGFVFVSSANDPELPAIDVGLSEGRDILWGKTKFAFRHVYKSILDEYDWFMKADDDTYVVVENLKSLLSNYSSDQPIYFGSHFKMFIPQGYMSGGAGYVLSREAVRRLVHNGLSIKGRCREDDDGAEDVEIGKCLAKVGVKPGDNRDELGQGRFFPMGPEFHLSPGHMNKSVLWYGEYAKHPEKDSFECCSDSAISFHYISDMYVMEYLIYHLKPVPRHA